MFLGLPFIFHVLSSAGTAVVTRTQYIAGNLYTANRYACQSCPDPHMRMTVAGDAYTCACTTGYTLVGVSGIGNQSCVLTTLTNARKNQATVASRVTYYDSGAAGERRSDVCCIGQCCRCHYHVRPRKPFFPYGSFP